MYSGSTFVALKKFDSLFGTHQKIDRLARKNLQQLVPGVVFPSSKQILRFEGLNGPDGMKRKSGGKSEPRHFYDPRDPTDVTIIDLMEQHYKELVKALRAKDNTRASFEAAWLAHALVDGLTPAHHYPYDSELQKLRGGLGQESRVTLKDKLLIPGDTILKQIQNNWRMWGDNGLLATHLAFEMGVAIIVLPRRFKKGLPTDKQVAEASHFQLRKLFIETVNEVSNLDIYKRFSKTGWTPVLSRVIRVELLPRIIQTVTLAWYMGVCEAAGSEATS